MSQDRKFKGIWIPSEVWLNQVLSIQEKAMLAEVDSLQDSDRGCYASNLYFSEFFNLSKDRVSRIINSLVSKGYLHSEEIREKKVVVERRLRVDKLKFYGIVENTDTLPLKTPTPSRWKHRYPPVGNNEYITKIYNKDYSYIYIWGYKPWLRKKKDTKPKKLSTNEKQIKMLTDLGVDKLDAELFIDYRKQKRKVAVNKLIITKLTNQAKLANLTLAQAIKHSVSKEWADFKADWISNSQSRSRGTINDIPSRVQGGEINF